MWPRCDHGHSAVPLATPAVPSAPGLIPAPRHRQVHVRLEPMNVTLFADVIKVRLGHTRGGWDPIDLVLKLRERLVRCLPALPRLGQPDVKVACPSPPLPLQVRAQGHQLPVKEATLKRARLYIETVVGSLPKDLQVVLCPP